MDKKQIESYKNKLKEKDIQNQENAKKEYEKTRKTPPIFKKGDKTKYGIIEDVSLSDEGAIKEYKIKGKWYDEKDLKKKTK